MFCEGTLARLRSGNGFGNARRGTPLVTELKYVSVIWKGPVDSARWKRPRPSLYCPYPPRTTKSSRIRYARPILGRRFPDFGLGITSPATTLIVSG